MEIAQGSIVLCQFYFSDLQQSKNRPVLIFKDNLPHDDFIAIPISSKTHHLHADEILIELNDFASGGLPVASKLMIRKTFVVSKSVILKEYGIVNQQSYAKFLKRFCTYFGCH
jgi:mRNA interferase MazF